MCALLLITVALVAHGIRCGAVRMRMHLRARDAVSEYAAKPACPHSFRSLHGWSQAACGSARPWIPMLWQNAPKTKTSSRRALPCGE